MFWKCRYVISFKKKIVDDMVIKDSYICKVLSDLLKEYDFRIVKTDIYNTKFSKIYIKARSKDIFKIYSSFCMRLQDNITNSGFEREIIF